MDETVKVRASDGHELSAYLSRPLGGPIAGLVVLQEAFGVNRHIRSVADGYAHDGFLAISPALYDRVERGVELGYDGADREKGIALARRSDPENAVKDVAAAVEYLRNEKAGKCGVIGYCFGGSISWLAATRLDIGAAVGYYGGQIARYAQETPRCPVMLHFGTLESTFPGKTSTESRLLILRCRSSGMRRTTGSTAMIAPATIPQPRNRPGSGRWTF